MGMDQTAYAYKLDGTNSKVLQQWKNHVDLDAYMVEVAIEKGIVEDAREFNCVELELTLEDILAFEKAVLANALPCGGGVWWGPSDETDKENDLEFIRLAKEAIADGYYIAYDCWW